MIILKNCIAIEQDSNIKVLLAKTKNEVAQVKWTSGNVPQSTLLGTGHCLGQS